jgi:membrane protein implicated in regulation of membrane protease activity
MVGVALNIAALMIVALLAVALHFWHPKVELIIPAVTCVLAIVLYKRLARDGHRGNGSQRSPR